MWDITHFTECAAADTSPAVSLGLGLLRLPLPSHLCFPSQGLLSRWCLCWGLALGLVFLLAWLCHQAGISKGKQEEKDTAPFFPPRAGQGLCLLTRWSTVLVEPVWVY